MLGMNAKSIRDNSNRISLPEKELDFNCETIVCDV